MKTSMLIWSLLLAVPMIVEYFIWSRTMRPLNRWRLSAWVLLAGAGWTTSEGFGPLLLLQIVGLALLAAHVAVIIFILIRLDAAVMWLRSRNAGK